MKEYDKMISTQVAKFVREIDSIEEKALVFLQLEERVYHKTLEVYQKNSEAIKLAQEAYELELLETWTKALPAKILTKQIVLEGYAITLMNMVKLPPVMVKSLETSIGVYLNDYYMVYDAAHEDHDVKLVQLKKALSEYNLETEDPLISKLKEFKAALLTKFKLLAYASKSETDKPLTKSHHETIKKTLAKIVLKKKFTSEDDVLIFYDFLQLTAVIV